MLRATYRLVVLCILVASASVGYVYYHHLQLPNQQLAAEREKNQVLEQLVQRLTEERRVAEMIVTDQHPTPQGVETTLLFVEQARDGTPLPPKSFTIKGDEIWVAGESIRFQEGWLKKNDALRGHGILLFTKIFGQNQTPAQGLPIDQPGKIPDIYRGDPKEVARVSAFESELWENFWKLVDDKQYREKMGVEVASGKAVYFRAVPERLYRITEDARANPTVDWEPIKPIYREAMKKAATTGNVQ